MVLSLQNELTGEHSCIMIKTLQEDDEPEKAWLDAYWKGTKCIKLYKLIAHDAFVSCVNSL